MTSALRVVPTSIAQVDGAGGIGPLPFAMTPLIGRETHVALIVERLTSPTTRLLTLVGPGGIGKTRLALEAGHLVRPHFEDGAHLLRLASVNDPALVPVTLARALDVRGSIDDRHDWSSARDRRCLLVIDNFEQLLDAAPTLVDVLSACPHVTMLVTSRVPLNVSGEHEHQVPELSTPPDDGAVDPETLGESDAVRLFVERAVAVRPDFCLTEENAPAVARIARQLDGLPLAIELAAARTKHLPPEVIVDRLASSNDVLKDGPRDRPPHQRAIRDTIGWSFELLDQKEQALFCRLSIFAGGFLPQAAAYVAGGGNGPPRIQPPRQNPEGVEPILDACISLADKNLIVPVGEFAYQPRFSMLLTIRAFAGEELRRRGELESCARRHAEWYSTFAGVAAKVIRGPAQTAWLDWLQEEHANLRIALAWYRDREDTAALATLVNALGTFWLVRGHLIEGLRWMRIVLSPDRQEAIAPSLRADLCSAAGWLALRQGLPDVSRTYAEGTLAIARVNGSPLQLAAALRLLGDIEGRAARYAQASELMRESLQSYQTAGDTAGVADTLTGLAGIAMDTGEYDEAERTFRDAIDAAALTGDAILQARAIDSLSVALHASGNPGEARVVAERALDLYRTHGNVRGIAIAMDHVGKCSRSLGDLDRAWSCHRESLEWRRKVGDPRGMVVWLEAVAALLASCDAVEPAACVLGATDTIRQRGGFPPHNQEKLQLQATLLRIRNHLPPKRHATAWSRGGMMSLPDIVDLAYGEADRAAAPKGRENGQAPSSDPRDGLTDRGLTPRELDVARLLTMRLSDKEIGRRLSISPRTVSTHVTVILGKLGVHSRRDVLRFASETAPDRAAVAKHPTPPDSNT
ncbi:MAG: tetratricopeptide repeat protein [Chloroflexota bacterium]|nr:tetratricopeptide repeat protein [Chloroflexota bacterium]